MTMRKSLVAAVLLLAVLWAGGMQAGQQAQASKAPGGQKADAAAAKAQPAKPAAAKAPAATAPALDRQPPYLWAEVAFSDVMVFDYDRNGTRDRVQFWITIDGVPAAGKAGEADFKAESGSVSYFVLDIARKTRITDWLMGFNMGFPAPGEPHPITNIAIAGRTARFDLRGATWTITDKGDSWDKDTIELKDSSGVRKARFYGGDFRVVPTPAAVTEPLAIAANATCVECHRDAAVAIAASGGPHRDLECANCHAEHPPDKPGARPQCLTCHAAHSDTMDDKACASCHRGHAPATSAIAATVPDAYCAACHAGQAQALRASKSLHMGLTCATCHRKTHKASAACQFCHRATHPQHVMQKPGSCAACHNTAHDLKSGRVGGGKS
jgi:hypothetical protein